MSEPHADPSEETLWVYLLDMGERDYGACIACRYGDRSLLVDGAHKRDLDYPDGAEAVLTQLERVFGHGPPFHVSLLVVTHCHDDHVGCLPELVGRGYLTADWALVADEHLLIADMPCDLQECLGGHGGAPLAREGRAAFPRVARARDVDDGRPARESEVAEGLWLVQ